MTLIPTIYNAEHPQLRPRPGRPPDHQFRKDLIDPAFEGKASILNIPSIGIMDAAMMVVAEILPYAEIRRQGQLTKPSRQDHRLPD